MGTQAKDRTHTLISIQLLLSQARLLADAVDADVLAYVILVAESECERTLAEKPHRNFIPTD